MYRHKCAEYTNKIQIATVFLLFFLVASVLPVKVHAPGNTYHTHEELISMFKSICNAHPKHASYENIGKTYEGRDIWIFKIGNPDGGRVMWDGCLHGWEDMGSEIIYLMTEWLLESGEETAERILERNYVLSVPVVNMDSYERQNRDFEDCAWGVDLNRNFHTGWRSKEANNYDYPGPYAGSEPETQVMRNAFQTYRPDFYVNTHYGGGPALGYFWKSNTTLVNQVINRINEISTEIGVMPYPGFGYSHSNGFEHPPSSMGSRGMAIGDAYSFGACAWLFEVEGGPGGNDAAKTCYYHTEHPYDDVVDIYYPKCLPILIAMCEACEAEPPMHPPPVDTLPPSIEILSPENKTYTTSFISLNFTVDEATSWIGYSLDSQMNVTMRGNTTIGSLSDETHAITVYANDTAGNMGSSNTVYFTIQTPPEDTAPPNISIISPENKTYATSDISLTFTVDEQISWMAYNLDRQANITIARNGTLTSLLDGPHYLLVYANDTAGNMGASEAVYCTVDTTPPQITDVSQTPVKNDVLPEDEVKITATVTDELRGVKQVTLIYTYGNGTWTIVNMTNLEGNIWNATIPMFRHSTSVTYVVTAQDGVGNTITTEEMRYESQHHRTPEFPSVILLPIFTTAALLAVIAYKRKHSMKQ